MLTFEIPKSLVDLSINVLCTMGFEILKKGMNITENTDCAVNVVNTQMDEILFGPDSPLNCIDREKDHAEYAKTKKAALDMIVVKHMAEEYGDFPIAFSKHINVLPANFVDEIFTRLLDNFSNLISEYKEEDVEKFMNEKWCFPARLRLAYVVFLKCYFTRKVSNFNMNKLTQKYFSVFVDYLMNTGLYKDYDYMDKLQDKNDEVFIDTFISFDEQFINLTSISMQHLASGQLLWFISCNCPNLWYLDISGEMFDLQRYCKYKEDCGGTAPVTTSESPRMVKHFANFIHALCGLYANNGDPHFIFKDKPKGCFKLRRLLLPNCKWDLLEETKLIEEITILILFLPFLEEVTGLNMFSVLSKLNSIVNYPAMIKLKKFDGMAGSQIKKSPSKDLNKTKLPLVEEVRFIANRIMTPGSLPLLFPNMKSLTMYPYSPQAYKFIDTLDVFKNLVTLDAEYTESLDLNDMCEISKTCRKLRELSLTIPAICIKKPKFQEHTYKDRKGKPLFVSRVDKKEKQEYEYREESDNKYIVFYYPMKLMNVYDAGMYMKNDNSVPNFRNLRVLQFFNLSRLDYFAMYQIVRGSQFVQKFTIHLDKITPDIQPNFDEYFVGRVAPYLTKAKEIILAADMKEDDYLKLDGAAIGHLLYHCPNIRSIGVLGQWDFSNYDICGINYFLKENNYVARVH